MRRAVIAGVLLLALLLVWAQATGHVFEYAGINGGAPAGISWLSRIDGCDAGVAFDTATREWGVCIQWTNGE